MICDARVQFYSWPAEYISLRDYRREQSKQTYMDHRPVPEARVNANWVARREDLVAFPLGTGFVGC